VIRLGADLKYQESAEASFMPSPAPSGHSICFLAQVKKTSRYSQAATHNSSPANRRLDKLTRADSLWNWPVQRLPICLPPIEGVYMQARRNRAVKSGLIPTLVLFAIGQPYGANGLRPIEHLVLAGGGREVRHSLPEDETTHLPRPPYTPNFPRRAQTPHPDHQSGRRHHTVRLRRQPFARL
jgi:hypothetical protein